MLYKLRSKSIRKNRAIIFITLICLSGILLAGCGNASSKKTASEDRESSKKKKIEVIDSDYNPVNKEEPAVDLPVIDEDPDTVPAVPDYLPEQSPLQDIKPAATIPPKAPEEPATDYSSEYAGMTQSQENAVKSALSYIDYDGFSRDGLIEQLSSKYGDQFSREDAEFAVNYVEEHNNIDWNEQAIRNAESYLELTSFSRDGLIGQLSSQAGSQFTKDQAEYAVKYLEDHNMVNWNEQAVRAAKSYMEHENFSHAGLIDQLTSEFADQFTKEQAEYAVSQLGY